MRGAPLVSDAMAAQGRPSHDRVFFPDRSRASRARGAPPRSPAHLLYLVRAGVSDLTALFQQLATKELSAGHLAQLADARCLFEQAPMPQPRREESPASKPGRVTRLPTQRSDARLSEPDTVAQAGADLLARVEALEIRVRDAQPHPRGHVEPEGVLLRRISIPHKAPEIGQFDYASLFGPYAVGVSSVILHEPYLGKAHQASNLNRFLGCVAEASNSLADVTVNTLQDSSTQAAYFSDITAKWAARGVTVRVYYHDVLHVRAVEFDTGIVLKSDRGIDLYMAPRHGEPRLCRKAEVDVLNVLVPECTQVRLQTQQAERGHDAERTAIGHTHRRRSAPVAQLAHHSRWADDPSPADIWAARQGMAARRARAARQLQVAVRLWLARLHLRTAVAIRTEQSAAVRCIARWWRRCVARLTYVRRAKERTERGLTALPAFARQEVAAQLDLLAAEARCEGRPTPCTAQASLLATALAQGQEAEAHRRALASGWLGGGVPSEAEADATLAHMHTASARGASAPRHTGPQGGQASSGRWRGATKSARRERIGLTVEDASSSTSL